VPSQQPDLIQKAQPAPDRQLRLISRKQARGQVVGPAADTKRQYRAPRLPGVPAVAAVLLNVL